MLLRTAPAMEETATSEVTTFEAFLALRDEWNDLTRRVRDEPFHRHEFLRAWIESFAPRAPLRIVVRRDAEGALEAALPLRPMRGILCGVPVRQLVSISNSHSCRADMLSSDPKRDAEAIMSHLLRDRSWDVVILKDVPAGGDGHALERAAERAGLPTGSWKSQSSPFVPLPASEEDLLARLPAPLRRNLRRRRRRLEERGAVTLERLESGPELEERLTSCLSVERGGWKGRRGTAIAQNRQVRDFYARLAATAAAHGYFSLYCMRLDERIIAFQYGLTYGDTYYLPKLAYDESLSDCSPGMLLLQDVFLDCMRRGVRIVDFLGDDTEWKRKWAVEARPHHWIFIFSGTRLGRSLHRAKFRWIPGARRLLAELGSLIPGRQGTSSAPD